MKSFSGSQDIPIRYSSFRILTGFFSSRADPEMFEILMRPRSPIKATVAVVVVVDSENNFFFAYFRLSASAESPLQVYRRRGARLLAEDMPSLRKHHCGLVSQKFPHIRRVWVR